MTAVGGKVNTIMMHGGTRMMDKTQAWNYWYNSPDYGRFIVKP